MRVVRRGGESRGRWKKERKIERGGMAREKRKDGEREGEKERRGEI